MDAAATDWAELLRRAGWPDAVARGAQLAVFEADLLRFGRVRNLVSRREPEVRIPALLAESIQALRGVQGLGLLESQPRVADLGSGAGIPGIPWAIASASPIDLLERRSGRAEFLERELRALRLLGSRVLSGDARALPRREDFRPYDLILAKAVAQLPDLLDWVGALLSPQGRLCLFGRPNALLDKRLQFLGWSARELVLVPDPYGPSFGPSALQLLERSVRSS